MARHFIRSSSQRLLNLSMPAPASKPFSIVVWVRPNISSGTHAILSWADSATVAHPSFKFEQGFSGIIGVIEIEDDGTAASAIKATGLTNDVWHLMAGVFTSDSLRRFYSDGSFGTDNTDSVTTTLSEIDVLTVACWQGSTGGSYESHYNGDLAELAVYNAALDEADLDFMYDNFVSPVAVRLKDLIYHWSLFGQASPEMDIVGGQALALENTPTDFKHPPMRYPARPLTIPGAASGASPGRQPRPSGSVYSSGGIIRV